MRAVVVVKGVIGVEVPTMVLASGSIFGLVFKGGHDGPQKPQEPSLSIYSPLLLTFVGHQSFPV